MQIQTLALVFSLQTNIKCITVQVSLMFEMASLLLSTYVLDSFGQASMIQHLTNPSPFPPEPSTVAGLFRGRGPVTAAYFTCNSFWLLVSFVSPVPCPVSCFFLCLLPVLSNVSLAWLTLMLGSYLKCNSSCTVIILQIVTICWLKKTGTDIININRARGQGMTKTWFLKVQKKSRNLIRWACRAYHKEWFWSFLKKTLFIHSIHIN